MTDSDKKLLGAVLTLLAALIGGGISFYFNNDTVVEGDRQVTTHHAPDAAKADGLDGVKVDPSQQSLGAPPAASVEGLNGMSID